MDRSIASVYSVQRLSPGRFLPILNPFMHLILWVISLSIFQKIVIYSFDFRDFKKNSANKYIGFLIHLIFRIETTKIHKPFVHLIGLHGAQVFFHCIF